MLRFQMALYDESATFTCNLSKVLNIKSNGLAC